MVARLLGEQVSLQICRFDSCHQRITRFPQGFPGSIPGPGVNLKAQLISFSEKNKPHLQFHQIFLALMIQLYILSTIYQ